MRAFTCFPNKETHQTVTEDACLSCLFFGGGGVGGVRVEVPGAPVTSILFLGSE